METLYRLIKCLNICSICSFHNNVIYCYIVQGKNKGVSFVFDVLSLFSSILLSHKFVTQS